jgi:CDP-diglyceride synthetase
MKKPSSSKSQAGHIWGILLGMLAIPVLGVMVKVFPQSTTLWEILMAAAGLVILRSVIGYAMPARGNTGKKPEGPASLAH